MLIFFIPANVTASNLNNMLGAGSGPNQLMRHVSSVGEHVSSSFTVTSIAKRANTFAGFDTTLELFKGLKTLLYQLALFKSMHFKNKSKLYF